MLSDLFRLFNTIFASLARNLLGFYALQVIMIFPYLIYSPVNLSCENKNGTKERANCFYLMNERIFFGTRLVIEQSGI